MIIYQVNYALDWLKADSLFCIYRFWFSGKHLFNFYIHTMWTCVVSMKLTVLCCILHDGMALPWIELLTLSKIKKFFCQINLDWAELFLKYAPNSHNRNNMKGHLANYYMIDGTTRTWTQNLQPSAYNKSLNQICWTPLT